MAIEIKEKLGSITISNKIFEILIAMAMEEETTKDKVWPGTKKGKIAENASLIPVDYSTQITVGRNKKGHIKILCPVIIRFGASIHKTTENLAFNIKKIIEEKLPGEKVALIIVHVTGIKSKNLAQRDVEVKYTYEIK